MIAPDVEAKTLGSWLWDDFVEAQMKNPALTAEEMANMIAADERIPYSMGAMAIEPGYLAGFDNEVTGFVAGATFVPMIGGSAFVGYIFDLSEGVDVAAFVESLEQNCNPKWNLCAYADQTVIGAIDNRVFFVMCPKY